MKQLAIIVMAALAAYAQAGPQGRLNPAKVEAITGTITAINVGYGMEYPSIVVNDAQIKVAPVWYFLENDFELKQGDEVRVLAAPPLASRDVYLYAIQIEKAGVTLQLRNPTTGTPLWTGPRGFPGRSEPPQARSGSGCIDPTSITTATGVIDRVTVGLGIQHPNLVLRTEEGKLLTIELGPERLFLAADFEVAAGATVTVKYALATCSQELVALELTNEQGVTVVLRNADGTPAW